ncbi:protease [Streptomyces ipomoeae]|uniref:Protease n=1 Tax=Streptomyces ipomoeae TaxID=103232 RepID=A0A540PVD1_9ACTN|nr:protease [Streptomyces ipomoeae]MDX2936911.1 protease [Streptomyces ipomoeae]TQE15281.1 protease [Streptomyces ipomoeae]TQE27176.1 protease [Streptomyces ipomoeae]TQE31998.1 protease [Streptomyces ipomoeae]
MTKLLLSLHVLAAIVAVGPITVAASMFPPSARKALAEPGSERAVSAVRLLHRICRVYGGVGIAVPVLGFATAMSMGVLNDAWLIVSMLLTALAAIVLLALVLPRQEEILEGVGSASLSASPAGASPVGGSSTDGSPAAASSVNPKVTVQLAMFTGVFNLLWATVTVLMIVRPGSTTGA